MSRLADNLPTAEQVRTRVRKGPSGACDIYEGTDLEDWRKVELLRLDTSWAAAQRSVDETMRIETPIDEDKFRYHWRKKCWHWTEAERRVTLEDLA